MHPLMKPCWFDNITLFVPTGVIDGITRWRIHRRFEIGGW